MTVRRTTILLLSISFGVVAPSAADTYALVINGLNKDPQERIDKHRQLQNLRRYLLTQARIGPARLTVLDANDLDARPTRETIAKTIGALASAVSPHDRLLLYYTGQANAVGETLRLNLPGEDITQQELAEWLGPVRAASQLVVLDCPCAGLAAQALTGRGRVVVCATTQEQVYSPRFGWYFVLALAAETRDTNSDGRISVLEAFTAAAREIERWYRQYEILPTETACLEDNGDGVPSERPWRHGIEPVDGLAASEFFLTDD